MCFDNSSFLQKNNLSATRLAFIIAVALADFWHLRQTDKIYQVRAMFSWLSMTYVTTCLVFIAKGCEWMCKITISPHSACSIHREQSGDWWCITLRARPRTWPCSTDGPAAQLCHVIKTPPPPPLCSPSCDVSVLYTTLDPAAGCVTLIYIGRRQP